MKKLYRSTENKKIAGIFGGLGEIFNIDPTLLRLIFVFIGLVTAVIPLVLAYLVGWIIIPKGKGLSPQVKLPCVDRQSPCCFRVLVEPLLLLRLHLAEKDQG
jgi:phage shock protein C